MHRLFLVAQDPSGTTQALAAAGSEFHVCGHARAADDAVVGVARADADLVLVELDPGHDGHPADLVARLAEVSDAGIVLLVGPNAGPGATLTGALGLLVRPLDPRAVRATLLTALGLREAGARLRESESRLQGVADHIHSALFHDDLDGKVVFANRRFLELFGLRSEDLAGLQLEDYVAPSWHEPLRDRHRRRVAGEAVPDVFEYEAVRRDGTRLWLEAMVVPVRGRDGAIVGTQTSLRDVTERHHAEAARLVGARLLAESQRLAGVGGWQIDQATGEMLWTEETYRIFGLPLDLPPGPHLLHERVHPEDRAEVAAWFAGLGAGDPPPVAYRIVRPDGTTRVLRGSAEVTAVPGRNPIVVGTLQDVTARWLRAQAEQVVGIELARWDGRAFFVEAAAHLGRLTGAHLCGLHAWHESGVDRLVPLALLRGGAVDPTPAELPAGGLAAQALSGELVRVNERLSERFPDDPTLAGQGLASGCAAPLLGRSNRVLGVMWVAFAAPMVDQDEVEGVVRLFATRVALELERQRAAERFTAVFEQAPDALLLVEPGGRVASSNQQAQALLGYTRAELVGLDVEALVPLAQRGSHQARRERFVADGRARAMGTGERQLSAMRKDGVPVPVEISLSPLGPGHDGVVIAAVRDVSERVRAQQERERLQAQVQESRKLQALGTIAAAIAHDFNNMLAVIAANTEYALKTEPSAATREALGEIASASARAASLVEQILTFARKRPPQRVVLALGPVVAEAGVALRGFAPPRVQIEVDVASDLPRVSCDAVQIRQLLHHLVTNAWHAIGDRGGTIAVRMDLRRAAEGPPDGLPTGDYVRLRVGDDGPGMDEETRARAFEPFYTTQDVGGGTGLGLSVCHGIATAHEGAISLDSRPGSGTEVTVFLPAAEAVPEPVPAPSPAPAPRGVRVLLIDDDPPVRRVAELMLKHLGCTTQSFADGQDALVALSERPDAFDVVFTDLNMPRQGGLEVAQAVRRIRADLPVVLLTGACFLSEEELVAANVRHVVDKPFSARALEEALAAAVIGAPRAA